MDNKILIDFTDFIMSHRQEDIEKLKPIWEEFKRLVDENYLLKIELSTVKAENRLLDERIYKAEFSHGSYHYDEDGQDTWHDECPECEKSHYHEEWCEHGKFFADMKAKNQK